MKKLIDKITQKTEGLLKEKLGPEQFKEFVEANPSFQDSLKKEVKRQLETELLQLQVSSLKKTVTLMVDKLEELNTLNLRFWEAHIKDTDISTNQINQIFKSLKQRLNQLESFASLEKHRRVNRELIRRYPRYEGVLPT